MDFSTALRELLTEDRKVLPCIVSVYKDSHSLLCHWTLRDDTDLRYQIERTIDEARLIMPSYMDNRVIDRQFTIADQPDKSNLYDIYLE